MPAVPPVVEKQLVDISLKSGMNEADRAERLDWTSQLSLVENLVLDDYGAMVKRPGLNSIAYTDENAALIGSTSYRLLPLSDGLGVVGANYRLYQYDEGVAVWRKKQRLPEFGVKVRPACFDTNTRSLWGTNDQITSVSHSTYFYVLLYNRGKRLCVLDKTSGLVVRDYVVTDANTTGVRAVVVGDRYIHIAYATPGGDVNHHVIDTLALPAAIPAATTLASPGASAALAVVDMHAVSGGSLIVWYDGVGTTAWVYNVSNVSAVADSVSWAAAQAPTGSSINATNLYVINQDNLRTMDIATLTVSANVTLTGFINAAAPTMSRIAVDGSGNARVYASVAAGATILTTGAATNTPKGAVYTLAAAATALDCLGALYGWYELTHPWYDPTSTRYYMGFTKLHVGQNGASSTYENVGAQVICDITESLGVNPAGAGTNGRPQFRPCAVLDEYTGYSRSGGTPVGFLSTGLLQRPSNDQSYTTVLGTNSISTSMTMRVNLCELSLRDVTTTSVTNTGPSHVLSGGCVGYYEGLETGECGFVDTPQVFHEQVVGVLGAGTRNYVAVYRFVGADGRCHFSRTSPVASATNTGAQINRMYLIAPTLSAHHGGEQTVEASKSFVELYRTTNGGTVYYLVAQLPASSFTYAYASYDDSTSDATLITQPQLFRQPGLSNGALDRYYAPASRHVVSHKDRVYVCTGSNVYYSSFLVDGEAPWFSPAFAFAVPGGSGDITGLASMDGILVIFKRDAIFLVDGDGPPENGGTGGEFSPPRRILTEYGCVDPRTIVNTPIGVMYRSPRGIELLSRGFQVAEPWIGEKVRDTVDTYLYNGGAAFDRVNGRVLFVVGASQTHSGLLATGAQGRVLCYDVNAKAWSVFKTANGTAAAGSAIQDVCFTSVSGLSVPSTDQVFYLDAVYYVYKEDYTNSKDVDNTVYVPFAVETGWIKGPIQDRIRVSDFLFLGKRQSNHKLTISVYYDYSSSVGYSKSWEPGDISADLEQLELQIPRQSVQAVKFRIEDAAATDTGTYPVGTGKAVDILALGAKVGVRGGGVKLPSGQKG